MVGDMWGVLERGVNILLKGNVQHIGYRGIIEGTARKLNIKGYFLMM